MPFAPRSNDGEGHQYNITSYYEKLVADYCRISILDVAHLDWIDFLIFRRDALIYKLSQSEGGQEYLDEAWLFEQTKPDRAKLRAIFGGRKERKDGEST